MRKRTLSKTIATRTKINIFITSQSGEDTKAKGNQVFSESNVKNVRRNKPLQKQTTKTQKLWKTLRDYKQRTR